MTGPLRDELARVAERAPVAEIPADTWARARRARGLDRALVVAAAAAVIALVAGVALLPHLDRAVPVAAGSTLGVPGQIWGVPERLTTHRPDGSWSSDLVQDDLAIGPGAVAYVTPGGLPVVIGAGDGRYHLLDLPGFLGNSAVTRSNEIGLALSPDGRRLAYAWAGPAPASDGLGRPSGVRVVDLETGTVRTIRVGGSAQAVVVDSLTWSPGSSWLVWRGRVATKWTDTTLTSRGSATGRIAPGVSTSQDVPVDGPEPLVAVADDGVVSLLTPTRLTTWDGRELRRARLRGSQPVSTAAISPSGDRAVVGSGPMRDGIWSVDLTNTKATQHPYPARLYPDGADNRPLGWIDDDLLVALVSPRSADGAGLARQLVVTTPQRSKTSTYRIVGRIDTGVPDSLSVAVDLMSLSRSTVERPEPDWPWSNARLSLTIGLGVAGALALLYGVRRLLLRSL